jgi:hypothetical protein
MAMSHSSLMIATPPKANIRLRRNIGRDGLEADCHQGQSLLKSPRLTTRSSEKKISMIEINRHRMGFAGSCLLLSAMLSAGQAQNGNATLPTVNGTPFTSGPVTVDNAHCGYDYALGGGAFYSASVPAASGFQSGCTVTITNTDVSACKGKSINVSGIAARFVLWPGQTVQLTNINDVWAETINPGRWRPNCGGTTLIVNTDSTNGSDVAGVSDGLGTGTEAFKSVQFALQYVLTDFDFAGSPQTRVKILMAAGSIDPGIVHFSPHGLAGAQGGF